VFLLEIEMDENQCTIEEVEINPHADETKEALELLKARIDVVFFFSFYEGTWD
jgi:hypothetical protein